MWDFIVGMIQTPDAQTTDPYLWLVVLLAHFVLGLFLTAALGLLMRLSRAVGVATLGYLILAEGPQLLWYGSSLSDSLLDTFAVLCGALVAYAAWENRGRLLGLVMALFFAVGWTGIRNRQDRDR